MVHVVFFLAGHAAAAPRAVLVLRPGLTAEHVFGRGTLFAPLLPRASIGVMNTAVRGPRMPASAYLTLGAGERMAAGPLSEPIRFANERIEGDPAAVVYERRIGAPVYGFLILDYGLGAGSETIQNPKAKTQYRMLHPDWAAFRNASDPSWARAAGSLGQALRSRGGIGWVGVGEAARTRLGALAALDAAGIVAAGRALPGAGTPRLHLRTPLKRAADKRRPEEQESVRGSGVTVAWHQAFGTSLVVLDLPSSFEPSRLVRLLERLARDPELDVLLVSPYPPPGPGGAWDQLPPILGLGPAFPPGRLTSSTTRTAGLVANIDVAPTLLAALGIPVPAAMGGRVMRSEGSPDPAALLRFAHEAALAQRAVVPVGIGGGAAAIAAFALILLALRGGGKTDGVDTDNLQLKIFNSQLQITPIPIPPSPARPVAESALLFVAASPLAMLLATVTRPQSVTGLTLAVAGWAAAAALFAVLVARLFRRTGLLPRSSPLLWLYVLTVAAVSGDLLSGGRLIALSPLSTFPVTGIRFYGLGNEYMGVLVGMGVLAPLLIEDRLGRCRWAQAALFLGLLALIGSPYYGADFGGALTAAAAFGATLALGAWPRRPLRVLGTAAAMLAAAGAAAVLWDALRPPPLRSHLGDFAHAVWSGGWPAAEPVLRRKAAMNLRLLTSGYALVPMIGVAPLLGLWYHGAGRWLRSLLTERLELRAAIGGSVVGAWTALLTNDSGISPWMFITAAMIALLLDEQLRALQ